MIDGVFDKYPETKVFRADIWGQCWTTHRETDAMWRIYSPDKQGVKVRCSIRNLLESLLELNQDHRRNGIFIGKVNYLPKKTLLSILRNIGGIYGKDAARSLLLKRREFKHEAEVRLISTIGAGEIQNFEIDPYKVFDEIIFDPRMNKHICESYKKSIKANGFKRRVAQSVMYQLPRELSVGN